VRRGYAAPKALSFVGLRPSFGPRPKTLGKARTKGEALFFSACERRGEALAAHQAAKPQRSGKYFLCKA
jgi:hypothetical protein